MAHEEMLTYFWTDERIHVLLLIGEDKHESNKAQVITPNVMDNTSSAVDRQSTLVANGIRAMRN